jgi:hypothetical protein
MKQKGRKDKEIKRKEMEQYSNLFFVPTTRKRPQSVLQTRPLPGRTAAFHI